MYANPYESLNFKNREWLKSNFHIHAGTGPNTCGANEIDDVISAYKEAGYDVLTISNHRLYTDASEYQKKYDMILINGYEYSDHPHMLCIGNKTAVEGTNQFAVNECLKEGGFVIMCHPNWQRKEYWSWANLMDMKGYTGIEIFNSVIFRLKGTGLATDTWDFLLSQGKLVWGFGNDDFHRWHNLDRSWNVIYAKRDQESVRESIDAGSLYVSTGLILHEFSFENNTVRLHATSKDTYVKENKYVFIGKDGKILKEMTGELGEYKMEGSELYVRAQVISEHGAMLWTQPIYDRAKFLRP